MKRREFITLLGCATAVWPLAERASAQPAKVYRVGVILQGGPWYAVIDGLREGLKKLDFIEGNQFVLDIRDTRGDLEAVEKAARNLEEQKVNLIYTVATSVSLAAKRATLNVPQVFVAGTDPVAVQLVDSIARPGGRSTGVHFLSTDLTGKNLDLLRQIVPHLRRVATFYNPSNRSAIASVKEGREAARHLGLELIERQVASPEELNAAVRAFRAGEADAYLAVSDAMVDRHADIIIEMGKTLKLPTMFYQQELIAKGGLVSYSTDVNEAGRVSAKYVQRILTGTSPTDLPVERIDRLVFMINLKTAKEIGLTIPDSVLIRADKVIE
jgi:putative tryptophan/tyrosine transport system substrate-binding protein